MAQMARRPAEWVKTPVVAVFDETPDVRTFRMARPEGFEFKAGQFLTIRVRADGKEHVRCYSISSPPDARGHLEITVKRIGLVSGALHATVRPGSMLSVRPPGGAFVYPTGEDRPLVLIAGGVGITPLMSMLRHAIDAEPWRPVTLFYSVRTVEDIAFRDELRMWLDDNLMSPASLAKVEENQPDDCRTRWHRACGVAARRWLVRKSPQDSSEEESATWRSTKRRFTSS
jgi:ferredoxin-NADP reductase